MKKPESAIRTKIVIEMEKSGGWALVVSGSTLQKGGTPDIIGTMYNTMHNQWHTYALEVKTDDGEPSARQLEVLRRMGQRGFCTGVVRSVSDLYLLNALYGIWHKQTGDGHPVTFKQLAHVNGLEDEYNIWK